MPVLPVINVSARWRRTLRLRAGVTLIGLGARLMEGASCEVRLNGKPWRTYRTEVQVHLRSLVLVRSRS